MCRIVDERTRHSRVQTAFAEEMTNPDLLATSYLAAARYSVFSFKLGGAAICSKDVLVGFRKMELHLMTMPYCMQ